MKTRFILSLAAGLCAAPLHQACAITAYGLTPTGLISFDTATPGTVVSTATFSGLTAGDSILDIDFRPQTASLYGIAASGRLYTINPLTGAATPDTLGSMGTVEHMDFNPVANRLRVFSAGDQNFRITPSTGAVTPDGTFAFNTGDPNFGVNPTLGSAAYSNNFVGAAATTLYSVDSTLDILISHTGTPQFSTLTTVGALGVDIGSSVGFDIVNNNNLAFLSNAQSLYSVNLTTGALTPVGTIGGSGVFSIAVVPEPSTIPLTLFATVGLLSRRRR